MNYLHLFYIKYNKNNHTSNKKKQLLDCTSLDSKCFSRKSLCGWQLLSRNAGCGGACGEEASAAAGAAAGRGEGKRPGRWPGSGVAVRPCCGTEPGSEAGTSPGGLEERGSPAPPASASSSCSGTRYAPERNAKVKLVLKWSRAETYPSDAIKTCDVFALRVCFSYLCFCEAELLRRLHSLPGVQVLVLVEDLLQSADLLRAELCAHPPLWSALQLAPLVHRETLGGSRLALVPGGVPARFCHWREER